MNVDRDIPLGPTCKNCGSNEARCAFRVGCCARCGHFRHLDDNGNPTLVQRHRPRTPEQLKAARRAMSIRRAERALTSVGDWFPSRDNEHMSPCAATETGSVA